jgi:thioredoxin 1
MNDKVTHVGDADFDAAVLQSDEPVLVDFWAEWCGPCKMIAPVLDELADAYEGRLKVVKLNVDDNRATAIKYHVRNIPLLLLFKDGQVQATQVGAVGKGQLTQMIDKAIGAQAAWCPAPRRPAGPESAANRCRSALEAVPARC